MAAARSRRHTAGERLSLYARRRPQLCQGRGKSGARWFRLLTREIERTPNNRATKFDAIEVCLRDAIDDRRLLNVDDQVGARRCQGRRAGVLEPPHVSGGQTPMHDDDHGCATSYGSNAGHEEQCSELRISRATDGIAPVEDEVTAGRVKSMRHRSRDGAEMTI